MYFLIKTILTSTYKHIDYTSYVDYTGIRFILSDLQQVAPKSILMQMAPDHFFSEMRSNCHNCINVFCQNKLFRL